MKSIEYDNSRRKSSSATVVPPHKQIRKASTPLTINCKDNGRSVFYDTGSMTDMSPTTAVSSRMHLPIFPEEPQSVSLLSSVRNKVFGVFSKNPTKEERTISRASTQCEKASSQHGATYTKQGHKANENSSDSTLGKNMSKSMSDSHLSPGSTAVGCDDDEERQGYFRLPSSKKKKSPRGWVAAVLMVVVGALIAVTFVLVGLGKALGGNNSAASSQTTSSSSTPSATIISTVMTTTPAITTTVQSAAPILVTLTLSPTPAPSHKR